MMERSCRSVLVGSRLDACEIGSKLERYEGDGDGDDYDGERSEEAVTSCSRRGGARWR